MLWKVVTNVEYYYNNEQSSQPLLTKLNETVVEANNKDREGLIIEQNDWIQLKIKAISSHAPSHIWRNVSGKSCLKTAASKIYDSASYSQYIQKILCFKNNKTEFNLVNKVHYALRPEPRIYQSSFEKNWFQFLRIVFPKEVLAFWSQVPYTLKWFKKNSLWLAH